MTTTTTSTTPGRTPAPGRAPSQRAIAGTIAARALADRVTIVGALAFYSLAMGAGVGALWPPLKKTFASLSASLPAAFDRLLGNVSLATPAGWMNAEMMSLVAPGFLIATAIISGGAATAGEERARTMGLVLSTSTSRTTFLAAKTAAMVAHVLMVSVAMFIGLVVGNLIGHMGIGVGLLLAATAQATLVGLVFGAIALTIGAAGADRRQTMTISAGIAGLSFVLAVILPMNESLAWLAKLNFWYPYIANPALVHGIDGGFAAVLAACAVIISAVGFVIFPRRDLRG
jgi:ABC-2 type transport system permease protein